MSELLKTAVYIDGLNLYYGCLKNSPYKWLDPKALVQNVLPKHHQISTIKYFTALVKSKPNDRLVRKRQEFYIQALKAYRPEIEIWYGHFLQNTNVTMGNANPPPNTVAVIKNEEKGSDVNLAVHLLNDAWLDKFDCGVVVSNDSDMAGAMELVRKHHKSKTLGLIPPLRTCQENEKQRVSHKLKQHAHFIRLIRPTALRSSQLPDVIPDTKINKPRQYYL